MVTTNYIQQPHIVISSTTCRFSLGTMLEVFRRFMSVLIQEKVRVEEERIYLDPRISFQEIDRYFFSGCACAYFQIATDVYTDLRYNQEEWE